MKLKFTLILFFAFWVSNINAQTTETFEGFTSGCSTSFTSGGITFNGTRLRVWIPGQTGPCGSINVTGLGVGTSCSGDGCSATSDKFFDNGGNYGINQTYIIATSGTLFTLKSMYVYISTNSGTTPTTGSVTFVGKKAGSTVFTVTKTSWPNSTNGYSFVNFDTEGGNYNSITSIDALEITPAGSSINYLAVDNFRTGPPVTHTVTTSGTLNAFSTCAGLVSAAQSFTVSGTNLSANIVVTPPTGYEVSTTVGSGYAASVSLPPSSGTVNTTTIYTRLTTTASGTPSGNITCASTGATTQNVSASGTVNALPTITLGSVSNVNTSATSFSLPYSATTGTQYSITTGTPTAMPGFTSVTNASIGTSPISVTIPASAANTYNFVATVRNSTTGCVSANNNFTVVVSAPSSTLTNLGITSTSAAVAYSLRKLSSSYAGAALQVRRSSDNATQDIGFTASGDLDTAALKTFVGSNNGFVTIWYDQSSNARNLTQTTAAKQPAIINAGVIFRKNNKPTVFFDGTDDGMLFSGTDYLTANGFSVNLVAGSNSASNLGRRALQGKVGVNWLIGPYTNAHTWFAGDFNHVQAIPWSTTQVERFTVIQANGSANTSFRNGSSITSANNKTEIPGKLFLGTEGTFAEPLDGFISEVVSYASELNTTDRQSMETSQAAYYALSTNANLSALATTPTTTFNTSFAANTIAYTTNVANATSSITVTPTKEEANATIEVRINNGTYTTVASGNASGNLNLNVGANTIDVRVTAQDGTTIKTYTITVTRASAPLSTLNITNNSATNAYSVRKLTADYTGFAIRVRRSSDNTAQDIGFTTAGDLDTASLKTFVGSNSGFVTIWYDQSGNGNNAANTNNASQPSIVINGVINRLKLNGNKPTITAATATNSLSFAVSPSITGASITTNAVATMQATTPAFGRLVSLSNGNTSNDFDNPLFMSAIIRGGASNTVITYRGFETVGSVPFTLDSASTITSTFNERAFEIRANNNSAVGGFIFQAALLGITYGRIFNHTNNGDANTGWVGSASEVVLFASALNETDRQSMEASQTNYHLTASCTPTVSTFTVAACGTYTWAAKGNKQYTASNTTDTIMLVNAAGCDSIVTLNLTINVGPTINSITPTSVCVGSPITINVDSTATQVQWQLNGSTVSTNNSLTANPATTTTVAGTGTAGNAANQLNLPYGVAVDTAANIYVADRVNHRIQKFPVGSNVGTTVAGDNVLGSNANELNFPLGVVVDAAGNIYVADQSNNRIQKWAVGATTGTTVAGTGTAGIAIDQLNRPYGVAVDAAGNIYVADRHNHRIQKWEVGATVGTTVAGTGTAGSAANQLSFPSGVAVDAAGNIYVAEHGNDRIQKWLPGALTGTTVAGGNVSGSANNQLNNPTGVAVDAAGNIYVADQGNHRIQKWAVGAASGTTVAGGNGQGSNANQLNSPSGVAIDAAGNIYLADLNNNRIQKIAAAGKTATFTPTQAGTYTAIVSNGTCSTTSTVVVVKAPTNSTFTVAACGTYIWAAKGNKLYTASNTTDTIMLVNAAGCDSIVTLNLTINVGPALSIATSGATTFCAGDSVTLTANLNAGTNNALQLNGSNYAKANPIAALNLTNNLSIEAWVKPSFDGVHYIVSKGISDFSSGHYGLLQLNNKIQFTLGGAANVVSTANITPGVYTHVAATYDGASMKLYINGVLDNSTAYNQSLIPNTDTLQIGRLGNPIAMYNFNGEIDELRIWNTAKTATEINNNKNAILPAATAGLVAYYRFSETTGTTTADASSNGNTATLVNAPSFVSNATALQPQATYTWLPGGAITKAIVAKANNTYKVTTNFNGCTATDSVVVKVNQPTTSTFTVTACGTYTWAAKGNKQYTASNTTDTIMLKNAAGCDSIVTLNLTITNCPLTTLNITNNSATNAYSVRKLTAAYTGFALRVRRSSDNNTQDIGFTTAGDLDTASLKTFIGSNSGFVTIWYDQSGNGNNATNTNNATQPSIVVNGVVNRLAANGNKPTITAATATNALSFAVIPAITGNGLTANAVATMQGATPAFGRLVSLSNGNTTNDFDNNLYTGTIIRDNTDNNLLSYRGYIPLSKAPISLNAGSVITSTIDGGTYTIRANNQILSANFGATNTNFGVSFGRIFNHTNNGDATTGWVGSASEVLLFGRPLNTTDRQSMEATQTNYYLMIYTTWNGTTWSNGAPSSTVDAIIASNTAPASFTCKALTINSTFALNTTGITATVNGNIVNNGNGIAGTGGLIVNANSTISGTAISFNGALTVNTGATLTTGGLLTLASNATNTARVANSAGNISGTVAVQRYLPGKRAYRFVTAPLSSNGLTDVFINNSWQTQTHIVGPSGTGLDAIKPGYSMLAYNSGAWQGVSNTTNTTLFNNTATASNKAFVLFVTGDRTIDLNSITQFNNSTLSATGKLLQGTQTFALGSQAANSYHFIGNPYASPVNLNDVYSNAGTSNINQTFYTWDPQLGSGTGGYVTINRTGNNTFSFVPNTGTTQTQHIQSGQAFFVQATATASTNVSFEEDDKSSTNINSVFGAATNTTDNLYINLQKQKGSSMVTSDGVLASFGASNTKAVNWQDDAEKLSNNEEGISIKRNSNELSIERRPFITNTNDTVFLKLNKLTPNANYILNLQPQGWDAGIQAFLVDKLLSTETEIDLKSSNSNIGITSSTANAVERWMVVFRGTGTLPNRGFTLGAEKLGSNKVKINWEAKGEVGVRDYTLQKSADGVNYQNINTQAAKNSTTTSSYTYTDNNPVNGLNYYRVKTTQNNDIERYSTVITINFKLSSINNVVLYPNPAVSTVQISTKEAKELRIVNVEGKVVYTKSINASNAITTVDVSKFGKGVYMVEVISNNGEKQVEKLVISQ